LPTTIQQQETPKPCFKVAGPGQVKKPEGGWWRRSNRFLLLYYKTGLSCLPRLLLLLLGILFLLLFMQMLAPCSLYWFYWIRAVIAAAPIGIDSILTLVLQQFLVNSRILLNLFQVYFESAIVFHLLSASFLALSFDDYW